MQLVVENKSVLFGTKSRLKGDSKLGEIKIKQPALRIIIWDASLILTFSG